MLYSQAYTNQFSNVCVLLEELAFLKVSTAVVGRLLDGFDLLDGLSDLLA